MAYIPVVPDPTVLESTVTFAGTGAVVNDVLLMPGNVQITKIYGVITEAGTLVNCTDAHLAVFDETNTVPITKTTTGTLTAAAVGTYFTKNAAAAAVLAIGFNDQCRLTEGVGGADGWAFELTASTGAVATTIQFNYTTTDEPIDFDVFFHIEYRSINGGTLAFV